MTATESKPKAAPLGGKHAAPPAPDAARAAAVEVERILREGEQVAASAPRAYVDALSSPSPSPNPQRVAELAKLLGRGSKAILDDAKLGQEIRAARDAAGTGGARSDDESRELSTLKTELAARQDAVQVAQSRVHETFARIDKIQRAAQVRSDSLSLASRLESDLLRRIAIANA